MTRTIVDVHVLQTVPPSNLNRDDTGSPKTAVYGGVRRARVSSQAWKRASRKEFGGVLSKAKLGVRTKKIAQLVSEHIREISADYSKEQSDELAARVLKVANIKTEKPKAAADGSVGAPETGYLLFLSRQQIVHLAQLAVDADLAGAEVEKSAAKVAADSDHSVDLALFGRMVADAPDLNVDATAQVAHAISVHPVDNEYDYFTAVDDNAPEDNAGAGMIGTIEFNSSTLYRYATVNVDGLHDALGTVESTVSAVTAFVDAFVRSMPTGKQNTFANRTLPDAVVVTVRDKQSINLVGAFEDAIVAEGTLGRLGEASNRLAEYASDVDRAYGTKPIAAYVVRLGHATEPLDVLGESVNFETLGQRLGVLVTERIGASE